MKTFPIVLVLYLAAGLLSARGQDTSRLEKIYQAQVLCASDFPKDSLDFVMDQNAVDAFLTGKEIQALFHPMSKEELHSCRRIWTNFCLRRAATFMRKSRPPIERLFQAILCLQKERESIRTRQTLSLHPGTCTDRAVLGRDEALGFPKNERPPSRGTGWRNGCGRLPHRLEKRESIRDI